MAQHRRKGPIKTSDVPPGYSSNGSEPERVQCNICGVMVRKGGAQDYHYYVFHSTTWNPYPPPSLGLTLREESMPLLADNECAHGRLPGDRREQEDPCGCWSAESVQAVEDPTHLGDDVDKEAA